MHPRNPYQEPPDFASLADCYPPLKPFLTSGQRGFTIDFKSDEAQRHLTSALLLRDFSLKISLPANRLCPPVPNRLNYVLWIQDIVAETTKEGAEANVWGIDIGTGASAIYPLLACSLEPNWMFIATDIDPESLETAKMNVSTNNLQDRVHIIQAPSKDSQILFPLEQKLAADQFYFTMCNPPFYSSRDEVEKSARDKEFAPNAVCTGADVEMITSGGESTFVFQMVQESLIHRERWYTSMLGKMSTLSDVVKLLRDNKIDNYAITEFVQGQTKRWAIGWSFGDERLTDTISRISNPSLQSLMPQRNTLRQPVSLPLLSLLTDLRSLLAGIEGVRVEQSRSSDDWFDLIVQAPGDTWTRSARRRKKITGIDVDPGQLTAVRSRLSYSKHDGILECNWMKGKERGLFESLFSHLCRKLT